QTLALPRDPGALLITVDEGVTSTRGGEGLSSELHNRIGIPGLDSLRVDHLEPTLATNDDHQPRQVLVVNFNGAVRSADVAARLHAWVLPEAGPGGARHHQDVYPWGVS